MVKVPFGGLNEIRAIRRPPRLASRFRSGSVRAFALGEKAPLRRHRSLRDQIERAALSVSNNIAEGFERGTTNELLAFLYIARGSAGEVRSMLCVMERMSAFSDLKSEISNLKSLAESNFAPIARLGAAFAGLPHPRPAPSHVEIAASRSGPPRPR